MLVVCGALLLACADTRAQRAGGFPFEVTRLGRGSVVLTSQPFSANSLLVRTASGAVILVDTPTTASATRELLRWSVTHWGRLPRHAINSHWHADAAGGNGVLLDHGVEVISSERTAQQIRGHGVAHARKLAQMLRQSRPAVAREVEQTPLVPARRTLKVGPRTKLTLSGERIWLVFAGPSHSADSIGVYFPRRKLLYGGCTVRSDGRILGRDEADFKAWPRVLRSFSRLGAETVVPGHGRRFDPAMITESLQAVRSAKHAKR